MTPSTVLSCSRCFREAPPPGSPEFEAWGGSSLGELEGTAAGVLLCPECREEAQAEEELGGEG
jgi:hypothetical protein